jgi:hypothetical protein
MCIDADTLVLETEGKWELLPLTFVSICEPVQVKVVQNFSLGKGGLRFAPFAHHRR